jgi:hypothetical protein
LWECITSEHEAHAGYAQTLELWGLSGGVVWTEKPIHNIQPMWTAILVTT